MKKTNILLGSAVVLASLVNVGSVFAATTGVGSQANPDSASTTVSTTLTVPHTDTPKAPTDPEDPNNGLNEQNTVDGEDGNLGIAYYPKSFNFSGNLGSANLQLPDSGNNTTSPDATYNVGVKDNTHTDNEWTLTAQLIWNDSALPGSTISLANSTGEVKQNNNDGKVSFQLADLVNQSSPTVVTGEKNVVINSSAKTIMTKEKTSVGIGTYDYELGKLGSLKLDIPNATSLKAGTYSGTVTWNLSVTPGSGSTN